MTTMTSADLTIFSAAMSEETNLTEKLSARLCDKLKAISRESFGDEMRVEYNIANQSRYYDSCVASNSNSSSNMWDNLSDYDTQQYLTQIYVPIIFGLTLLIGIIGNGLVVYVIVRQCSFKCVTNIYLLNLAVADLLFLLICVPFTGLNYVLPSWLFGEIMCKLVNYVTMLTMATSIMTLTVMSVDRYYAVLKPVDSKRYRTPHVTVVLLLLVWMINMTSLIPVLQISQLISYPHENETRHYCGDVNLNAHARRVYTVTTFLAYYAIPLVIITTFYLMMARTLWSSVSPSFLRDNMLKALKYRKKVGKMLLVLVTVFAACGLPLHVIRLVSEFSYIPLSAYHFKVVAHCCSYMHSATNPIIYAFMSQNFRKHFREAFIGFKTLHCPQMQRYRDPEELPKSVSMAMRLTGNTNTLTTNHAISSSVSKDQPSSSAE